MKNRYKLFLFLLGVFSFSYSQDILTRGSAVSIVLENNYGIKMAKNNIKIADNNSSIFNNNYLPKVTSNASVNYSNNERNYVKKDLSKEGFDGVETTNYIASIGLNYTIFDGFGRSYNFKKLKESYKLSELEAKTIIENSLLQVFDVYYEIAQLAENEENKLKSLNISKQRLKRMEYAFEYGQATKLDVLNAEVDVHNDNISYLNIQQSLSNSKRNLNLILGRNVSEDFLVETNVSFDIIFNLEELLSDAKEFNVEMQKIDKQLLLNEYSIKISKSNLYPSLSLSGAYNYSKTENDIAFPYNQNKELQSNGFSGGLSLNWSIFDGGSTKTQIQNAKINADNLQLQKDLISSEIERNVRNGLETYNNSIYIMNAMKINVETNKRNFNRSLEQFKLGQITSIEFRLAQTNLLNAESSLNEAKFNAKIAELYLLQITGNILDIEF